VNRIYESVATGTAFLNKFFEAKQIQITTPAAVAIGGVKNVVSFFHLPIHCPKNF
jgi:hypothetical protein